MIQEYRNKSHGNVMKNKFNNKLGNWMRDWAIEELILIESEHNIKDLSFLLTDKESKAKEDYNNKRNKQKQFV